jgi:signal transduction histidine kinase
MPPDYRQKQPAQDPAAAVLEYIWRHAPTGLALLDGGCLVAWNPEARRLLECSVGGSPTACQRWLEAAAVRLGAGNGATAVLEARQPEAPALELAAAGEAGPGGAVVMTLRAVPDEGGQAGGRGLAEAVSTLSHELRTPLASMKSSLSLVLVGDAGVLNADQTRFLGLTLRNVTRLDRLVGDLLDIARDDAGCLRIDCRTVDLGPVLREALSLFDGGTDQPAPRLDTSGIPEHFEACVDPDKIVQIVANLVGNARKYVPPEGRVRVWMDPHPSSPEPLVAELARACGQEARTFTLVVEDNGPGIDPQIIDRVFEPFERGRAEVIGRIGGAGLGLHIVRRLAEAHGGKVSLATAPGTGTTVWVRLPVEPAAGGLLRAAAHLQAVLDRGSAAGNPRCLAILDARGGGAAVAEAMAAGRARAVAARGVAGVPCEPAPGILAVAVVDPAAWERDGGAEAAGWRTVRIPTFRSQPGPEAADYHVGKLHPHVGKLHS